MLLCIVNPSHSISRFFYSWDLRLHAWNTAVSLNHSFCMTFIVPLFCLIFPTYQVESQPCLFIFFSIESLPALSLGVVLDFICDSHFCPYFTTSLRFFHSLTQIYPFLKFLFFLSFSFFYSFSEIILSTSSFNLLGSDQEFSCLGSV